MEKCRAVYRERVLPFFPQTQKRFERHFAESYEIIRAMKVNPTVLKPREFDLEIALTIFGIKPVTLADTNTPWQLIERFGTDSLRSIGIDIFHGKRRGTGMVVMETEIAKALFQSLSSRPWKRDFFNGDLVLMGRMLGYSEGVTGNAKYDFNLENSLSGAVRYNAQVFWCLNRIELIMPIIEGYANAAALVEDMRQTDLHIRTVASIIGEKDKGKIGTGDEINAAYVYMVGLIHGAAIHVSRRILEVAEQLVAPDNVVNSIRIKRKSRNEPGQWEVRKSGSDAAGS